MKMISLALALLLASSTLADAATRSTTVPAGKLAPGVTGLPSVTVDLGPVPTGGPTLVAAESVSLKVARSAVSFVFRYPMAPAQLGTFKQVMGCTPAQAPAGLKLAHVAYFQSPAGSMKAVQAQQLSGGRYQGVSLIYSDRGAVVHASCKDDRYDLRLKAGWNWILWERSAAGKSRYTTPDSFPQVNWVFTNSNAS